VGFLMIIYITIQYFEQGLAMLDGVPGCGAKCGAAADLQVKGDSLWPPGDPVAAIAIIPRWTWQSQNQSAQQWRKKAASHRRLSNQILYFPIHDSITIHYYG
jgi:hypothetical protein